MPDSDVKFLIKTEEPYLSMPATATNMVQKTYIQTLRASFAPRTLAETLDKTFLEFDNAIFT